MFLIFDQGGHATRGLVFDESGNIVCRAECAIQTITNNELIVEHDPNEMITSFYRVLDELAVLLDDDFSRISEAGLATQRSSLVCWDKKNGGALTPVISWQDRRALSDLPCYKSENDKIHELTGLYLNPHYGATKMRWCLTHESSLKSPLASGDLCIAPLASFILFHLIEGRPFVVDPANASRTLLMNYKTLSWEASLLALFNIPKSVLPEIVNTQFNYGVLNYKNTNIPLRLCTGDQSAAIFMNGKPKDDDVFINVGTGAFVQQIAVKAPVLSQEKILASVVYANEANKTYVYEGTVNGAGSALDWLAQKEGVESYAAHLDKWSAECESPPIFINGVSGVGSPFWLPKLKSEFLTEASVEDKFIGVLESIVFLIYTNMLAFQNEAGQVRRIQMSGGLSNSRVICQKMADLSSLPVFRAAESEATALGGYFLLRGQSGGEDVDVKGQLILPEANSALKQRYRQWKKRMGSFK